MLKLKLIALALIISASANCQETDQPNILFIFCDDLNYSGLGIYDDTQAITPFIDSLSAESLTFTNAHANSTICGPSRASVFTGVLPVTSGHFGYGMNQVSWQTNPVLAETTTMFRHFKDNGYNVYASGKIFHKDRNRPEDFDHHYSKPFQGPYPVNGKTHSDLPESFSSVGISFAALENIPNYPEGYGWFNEDQPYFFESDSNRDLLGDELSVAYFDSIVSQILPESDPFFITLGMYSPHAPFHVPQKYFDLYPIDSIDLSPFLESHRGQAVSAVKNRFNSKSNEQISLLISESEDDSLLYLKQFIQGYYASVSFLDDQIGAILQSLEENGLTDNTYIILTSDHGYHLGSRRMVKKSTLWNDSSRIPLLIKGPGVNPGVSPKPVSLVDLFPTFLTMAGLPEPPHALDGLSIDQSLLNPNFKGTILSAASNENIAPGTPGQIKNQHHALVAGPYKYIYYSSGEDELYDIYADPHEMEDLSKLSDHQHIRNNLFQSLREQTGILSNPSQEYKGLFYGDFDQDLNGWIPSRQNDVFQISENAGVWNSKHLLLVTDSSAIFNQNVRLNQGELHQFEFKIFCESDTAVIRFSLINETDGETVALLDEYYIADTIPTESSYYFYPESPLGDITLRIQLVEGENVHLDDIHIIDQFQFDESYERCIEAEPMASNTPISQIESDSLIHQRNQRNILCEDHSSFSRQKWYQFQPTKSAGLIACKTAGQGNPLIEVYKDCDDEELIDCSSDRFDSIEFLFLESLEIGQSYRVRIIDKQFDNVATVPIKALYSDIQKAEIVSVTDQYLTLNDISNINFTIDSVHFVFSSQGDSEYPISISKKYRADGIYSLESFRLSSGQYKTIVSYTLQPLGLTVPQGAPFLVNYINPEQPFGIEEKSFELFPNPVPPSGNEIIISGFTQEEAAINLTLLGTDGRALHQWHTLTYSDQVNIKLPDNLSEGIYLLKIEYETGNAYTLKLLK
jgi:arylsulfatase A-like enzyme